MTRVINVHSMWICESCVSSNKTKWTEYWKFSSSW